MSQTFLTSFLRLGAEERARCKKVELEKQRREEHHRKVRPNKPSQHSLPIHLRLYDYDTHLSHPFNTPSSAL